MKLPLLRALLPRPATVEGFRRRWRRGIVIVSAFGLAGTGLALLTPAAPALAAAGCTATYSVATDWGAGFTAQLTVTNTGTTAITGWTVTYSYTQGQTLQNGWNGTWSESSGGTVTVVNAPYNGSLAPGASATGVGANFNETSQGNNHTLTASCTPVGGTTQPTINASPTSLSVQQGHTGTFTLALSAAPTSNETVSIASSGNSGLTASPTTLTFTPSNFATAQTVTVTANATGTGQTTFTASGAGYTSATVTANETTATMPSITATPTSLNVVQSKTGTFTLALSAAPTSNETVSITSSGNTGLTASPTTLTFTPSNFSTAQTVTITANAAGTGVTTFTASGTGYTSATVSATEVPGTTVNIMVSPASQNITQGLTGTVGVSLSAAPSANVTVSIARTSGNTGLSASPTSLTFTPSNFATAQSVTVTADASSTGAATFTASATGLTSVTFSATEAAACTTNCTHVADPFTGATPYLNPDYVAEVNAQVSADGGNAAEAKVATFQTAIWLDTMASINGGTTATGTRTGLQQQLTNAAAIGTASRPAVVEIVIYDLPGRDCAALASNGEIQATTAGLNTYEHSYIDPIASILQGFANSPIRVVAIIEPDSLPNAVTNTGMQSCSTAAPFYEMGTTYALNKLHAISNVYNYMDIAHSAWLGWPSNMSKTPTEYNKVVQATTAGYASIDGFISDTANYTPVQEPLLTNPNLNIGGTPIMNVLFYSFNPTFDELTYDTQMYNTLMSAGFPASKKFLIDTSRDGWGPTHPTTITNASDAVTYVNDNKIDKRPFRGDWCNQNNAGIGAPPTDQPFGSSSAVLAYVWIKPPGESDGDYPSGSHTHGDPHCDPSLNNQTDGNGNSFNTGSIPGFDVTAGTFFPAEFQMLVKNAFPAL
jgi:cellulose 1,4-beta-cellobiosidase